MGKIEHILVHTFYYTHNSFETMVRSLKDNGVTDIELYGSAPHLCEMYEYTPQERSEMLEGKKKLFEEYGIRIPCIFVPTMDCPVNIADENNEVREFSTEYVKHFLDDAEFFGVKGILIDSGFGLYDKDREAAWARSVESLKMIGEYAAKCGVEVYLRPLGTSSNIVSNLWDLQKMLRQINCPQIKACADLNIAAGNGERLEDYISVFEKELGYVRIGNFSAEGELCEGKGLNAFRAVVEKLEASEYCGDIGIEIGWERLDIPDTATQGIAKYLIQH